MNIVHVLWSGNLGGAENFAIQLSQKQAISNNVKILFCGEKGVLEKPNRNLLFKTFELKMRNGYDVIRFFNILKIIDWKTIDIIHLHNSSPFLLLLKLFYKIKIIQHIHANTVKTDSEHERLSYFIVNLVLFQLVDLFIANSDFTNKINRKRYKISQDRIVTIPCGIDIEEFLSREKIKDKDLPNNYIDFKFIIGIIANIAPAKGYYYFVQIAEQIIKNDNKIGFWIIGDGVLKDEIAKIVISKKLEKNIIFFGRRTDIPYLLSKINLFLFTSLWEAFGIVLLEAMVSKVPIVSFKSEGVLSILNENNSLLVESKNVEQAVSAIEKLLSNETLRYKIINVANQDVKNFDMNKITNEIMRIYNGLIE